MRGRGGRSPRFASCTRKILFRVENPSTQFDPEFGSAFRTWNYPRGECDELMQWNGRAAAAVRAAGGVRERDRGQHLRGPRRRWESGACLVADAIQAWLRSGRASREMRPAGTMSGRLRLAPAAFGCAAFRGMCRLSPPGNCGRRSSIGEKRRQRRSQEFSLASLGV